MNFYENSSNLTQFHKFCSAGSTGSVWNLDPGSRIRIRKSANQQKYGNLKIWKSGSLQIWKSENLETWKFENLETGTREAATPQPLRWAAWAGGVEIRRPRRGLHGVSNCLWQTPEEIFRLDLRLMLPMQTFFICLWQFWNRGHSHPGICATSSKTTFSLKSS